MSGRRSSTVDNFVVAHDAPGYDRAMYVRYEHSEGVDDVKKVLEAATALNQVDLERTRTALDIGSATCRYPRLLSRLGVQAIGLDLKADGFLYISAVDSGTYQFVNAAGTSLPFASASFDLVTVMMGTLNHIPKAQRPALYAEARRVLKCDGRLIVSVWDTACRFQSYLTIYADSRHWGLLGSKCDEQELTRLGLGAGFTNALFRRCCYGDDNWMSALEMSDVSRLVDRDKRAAATSGETSQILIAIYGD